MSYDISIISKTPSGTDTVKVRELLDSLGLETSGSYHYIFREGSRVYADADLSWESNGDHAMPRERVNFIQIHIPSAFYESHLAVVLQKCEVIASRLDWKVFDEQEL